MNYFEKKNYLLMVSEPAIVAFAFQKYDINNGYSESELYILFH